MKNSTDPIPSSRFLSQWRLAEEWQKDQNKKVEKLLLKINELGLKSRVFQIHDSLNFAIEDGEEEVMANLLKEVGLLK